MIWTSRLALIAYLLGGWLLPAAHHHGHHWHGDCQHSPASVAGQADSGHACCQHDHHQDELDSGRPSRSRGQASQAPTRLDYDGLCALCSARSLSSAPLRLKPVSLVFLAPQQSVEPIEPAFPVGSPADEHLSRGPPVIA